MASPQPSLLVKTLVTLLATGLLPLAISFYQLRKNHDALLEQVQLTHLVAARSATDRIEAYLKTLESSARALAATAGRSREATAQLVQDTMYALPAIVAVGVYNLEGGTVVEARNPGYAEEVAAVGDPAPPPIGVFASRGPVPCYLRLVEPVTGAEDHQIGRLVLIAETAPLEEAFTVRQEMGPEASMALANFADGVCEALHGSLGDYPAEVVERARSLKTKEAMKYTGLGAREPLVLSYYPVAGVPWVVFSRQPAVAAEVARQRMIDATWVAAGLAVLLTASLSWVAWRTVIQPLRRLVRAQRQLAGQSGPGAGSEITQLEDAFALLEKRVRDREELDKVFLGRYQVIDVLGSGAMGTVFRGFDPKLERPLALKTIRLESDEGRREKLVSTLLKEAVTSARFSHPNIVTVYDVADEDRAAFIAMELVEGSTLEDLVAGQGHLDWRQVVPLGAAIAHGLAAAHAHDLVHQDVKPANVLLGRDGSIKVTDFGISQLLSASTAKDVICGTPGYIAPETFEGAGHSPASDLFALGTLLYECLTGEHPFAGRTLRITVLNTIHHTPPLLDRYQGDLPPELGRLVFHLLEKDPAERPPSAELVAEHLDQMAQRGKLVWRFVPPGGKAEGTGLTTRLVSLKETRRILREAKPGDAARG